MATVQSLMESLKARGSEKTRMIYARHGIPPERTFGVKNADLKVVAKTIRGEQALALALYETGMMDAMYLAGMVADGKKRTRKQVQAWADGSWGMPMIAEHTVPWVAVEHADALALAARWTNSEKEDVASSGWCTYSGLVATKEDAELGLAQVEALMARVVKEIHGAGNGRPGNREKLAMNSFVISVGCYVKPLLKEAKAAAKAIGAVSADMGETACRIPLATESIAKVEGMGRVGRKRNTIRC